MLRGHRTYLQLFDEAPQLTTAKPERRGRSETLHLKRNELLIHRYYYYVKVEKKQYPDVLSTLENELFIAKQTIVNMVAGNSSLLKELNTVKPVVSYFKKKYPFMVW